MLCCAAAVLPALARTRDGGSVVGSSVFYSSADDGDNKTGATDVSGNSTASRDASEELSPGVAELSQEIAEHQLALADAEKGGHRRSSLVWICTATERASKVIVIDASNPAECLDSFVIPDQRIMAIACVPGATERDYPSTDSHYAELAPSGPAAGASLPEAPAHPLLASDEDVIAEPRLYFVSKAFAVLASSSSSLSSTSADKSTVSDVSPPSTGGASTLSGVPVAASSLSDDERAELASRMVLPTMWITTESGWLYIYAASSSLLTSGTNARALKCLKLSSCGLCITHARGKVFIGLGDGKTAVFHRTSDGAWCTDDYHVVDFVDRGTAVRAATTVANSSVWLGFKNCIYVVDAESLEVSAKIEAHPRKESQVRLLSWAGGDGVWVSIRLDSTLRLFHAYTHERLQDIDVEPYVDKMLGAGKLGFSFSRITALDMSCGRLWIGTGNGVIISLPLADASTAKESEGRGSRSGPPSSGTSLPGTAVRVYCDSKTERVAPASYVPFCCSSLAQLSFHGHRDAVKFFVTVSSSSSSTSTSASGSRSNLVMSGGEGYIDFRVGDDDDNSRASSDPSSGSSSVTAEVPAKMWSHLIVWEVATSSGSSGSH